MKPSEDEITCLLQCLQGDDGLSEDKLYNAVYRELQRIARMLRHKECKDHTLCTNALVHEAFLQLSAQNRTQWQSRGHFFAIASITMRRVLTRYARDKLAAKRGGGIANLPLDESIVIAPGLQLEQLLEIDQMLNKLEQFDAKMVRVIECRFFTGFTIAETAQALDMSESSVKRNWKMGQAWLTRNSK